MRTLVLTLLLVTTGCAKLGAIEQSPSRDTIRYAALLETEAAEASSVPEALHAKIATALDRRNLEASALPIEAPTLGATERGDRIELLLDDGGPAFLLVETSARFSVQVNGRYRWNVEADLSLVTEGDTTKTRRASVRVPVALVYSHQGAEEALAEAAPLVARRIAGLLDEWLSSRQTTAGDQRG